MPKRTTLLAPRLLLAVPLALAIAGVLLSPWFDEPTISTVTSAGFVVHASEASSGVAGRLEDAPAAAPRPGWLAAHHAVVASNDPGATRDAKRVLLLFGLAAALVIVLVAPVSRGSPSLGPWLPPSPHGRVVEAPPAPNFHP
ncbi:hypothetical protein [Phycisphaera mikurensis]|uniref:Uncharacterized protein n=1 Tax=Phycisphaera mikurensis (strain NBRC 102666 / KCTC 22515 / FYK2301M01) TaxID=1142394 RepID=I0IJE4_PHYMF|nr:hypothetical protein [Phycisphaera mikurensis]MBB6443209.1 hypothetical protein [Phycisphaera mikurensis]BAM05382.1 hypothetical protein PSMK_p00200 [Phycisphaera mikurensis NBRC 102666]